MSTFVFNFKPQFADAVREGRKLQTIRANRLDGKRPVPGDLAKLYTGLRTANAQLLRAAPVTSCVGVRMDLVGNGELVVDGQRLAGEERASFCAADGFAGWPDMRRFFSGAYGANEFVGFCVAWEPVAAMAQQQAGA